MSGVTSARSFSINEQRDFFLTRSLFPSVITDVRCMECQSQHLIAATWWWLPYSAGALAEPLIDRLDCEHPMVLILWCCTTLVPGGQHPDCRAPGVPSSWHAPSLSRTVHLFSVGNCLLKIVELVFLVLCGGSHCLMPSVKPCLFNSLEPVS
jgi:hypothetical protein